MLHVENVTKPQVQRFAERETVPGGKRGCDLQRVSLDEYQVSAGAKLLQDLEPEVQKPADPGIFDDESLTV